MSFEEAIRLSEILLGFTLAQQSVEHIKSDKHERVMYIPRILLAGLLLAGIQTVWVSWALLLLGLMILHRFQGPYNGRSDRMSLLVLICLCLIHILPARFWQEVVYAYLALQLILSYFISGWVKVVNPAWRSGQALSDVFLFSAYPVSEALRSWSSSAYTMLIVSWIVILFELLFPISVLTPTSLAIALAFAACFHFSNACFFGLNRFLWSWISAYPSLWWLHHRLLNI